MNDASRRRRRLVLLALLLLSGAGRAEEPAPLVLTLDAALSQALSHNRRVAASALEVARAKDRVAAAKARRWPALQLDVLESRLLTSLEFEFKAGVFGSYPGIGPVPATDTAISTPKRFTTLGIGQLRQPLSQLYKIELGVAANALGVEAAGEELREERREIAGAVRAAYYGALRARAALATADEAAGLAREVERLAREAVARETALAGDLLDARARLARAEADVATSQEALASSKELLNALLARDLDTAFGLADVPEPEADEPDLAASRKAAREDRPSVRRARLGASVAALEARIAAADLLPDVSLSVSYVAPRGMEFVPRSIATAGLAFSWEVFDGGRRLRELAGKRKAAEQASLRAREAEELAAVEVARDARRLAETRRLAAAARLAREAAAERLRVAKNRYGAGAALLADLLRAQTTLADASRQENEALLSYWTARADYEKSLGEDL